MGPRTSIRGNLLELCRNGSIPSLLQWGRGLPSAETKMRARLCGGLLLLQWGRGLPSAETMTRYYFRTLYGGFNGAADFHPRKRARTAPSRGRNSCFNGAADFHPRKLVRRRGDQVVTLASMGRRTSIRGNARAPLRAHAFARASMGPRTSIRGNLLGRKGDIWAKMPLQWGRGLPSAETHNSCQRQGHRSCFNGAADFHPRKRAAANAGRRREGGFNGAADFHPRKQRQSGAPHRERSLASMGPRTSIRGNFERLLVAITPNPASMGPRTSIRGNRYRIDYLRMPTRGFNGAADFHPRKLDDGGAIASRRLLASMGPRTSIRGNGIAFQQPRGNALLQWGRGLPSAETLCCRPSHLSWLTLQWGRGLPSAETWLTALTLLSDVWLQWGRGLPSAETSS